MKFSKEEKALLLGALFHDIGKFVQRCGVTPKTKHQEIGVNLVNEYKQHFEKIVGAENTGLVKTVIAEHHNGNSKNDFVNICRQADHLSASERVGFDQEDDFSEKWSHKYMVSLFSKIYLTDPKNKNKRYYKHQPLTKKEYDILIPQYESEEDLKKEGISYTQKDYEEFKIQLNSIFEFYKNESDFNTLIGLLLILFEKFMWCIPDFTGSENTDISLFNHLKDVAGISHAIYKSDKEGTKLNLIIGDLPGIQKYIFNVANKKPAKVLRGRSIFVQILTRQFASMILSKLGLTDANLIMLAGGKFYIIAQNSNDFDDKFKEVLGEIDKKLIRDFNYQLSFSAVAHLFDYEKLKNKEITFGEIIDEASYELLQNRNRQFYTKLFDYEKFNEKEFILSSNYIKNEDSNKVKCAVTDLPIRNGRKETIEGEQVDKQVKNEYKIGSLAPKNNVVIELSKDFSEVEKVMPLSEFKKSDSNKILLNPDLDELLKKENLNKDVLRNAQIIEVANYATRADDNGYMVMDFEKMEEKNNGAQILTLIKGDVDNLGLIMSTGLVDDEEDITAISRTTTLSNHLKYFFSFSLNGFLEDWEIGKIDKAVEDNYTDDQKVYTVFAGGDDLMIICPQSSSLKLLNKLNETFNKFVCFNPEVHISYSLTNFKHNTPIRIVAEMAESNQSYIKNEFTPEDIIKRIRAGETDIFYEEKNKAGLQLFDTPVKNKLDGEILKRKQNLIKWVEDENTKVTNGVLRNLLYFSRIMREFNINGNTEALMWHPKLTYMINRILKDKNGNYYDLNGVGEFFDAALSINKHNNLQGIILEQILYPLVCEAIYGTRKSKKEGE